MRLTTRTDLAIRILMTTAVNDRVTVRTSDIAEKCNASVNHLLQVVSVLHGAGYVATVRGRTGGLQLAKATEDISIGAVFRLLEAGTPFTECFDPATNTCPLIESCRLRNYLTRAVEAFYHELDMVTLADLVRGNCGLSDLLATAGHLRVACSDPAGTA